MRYYFQSFGLVCLLLFATRVDAAPPTDEAVVRKIATEDTVAIAFADIAEINLPKFVNHLTEVGVIGEKQAAQVRGGAAFVQGVISQLADAGARQVFCRIRQDDIALQQVPLIVLSLEPAADGNLLVEQLRGVISMVGGSTLTVKEAEGLVLIGSDLAIAQFSDSENAERADLVEAWNQADTGQAGIVLCGDRDSRRVVRELMPALPVPYKQLTGAVVADGIKHASIAMTIKADPKAKLTVTAQNDDTAKLFKDLYEAFSEDVQTKTFKGNGPNWSVIAPLVAAIKAELSGSQVDFDFAALFNDRDLVRNAMAPARAEARKTQAMNNLRQVMLGMLNYEAAYSELPRQAIVSADGKPLLSWRVKILPYLEQGDLYNQFKLDEPWDSPHNRKLISKMPEIYASPFEDGTADQFKTTCVVPLGEGCAFSEQEAVTYRQIKDGTSNTIAAVFAPAKQAVVWTRPADLELDMAKPKLDPIEEVNAILFAYFDSSVRAVKQLDTKTLKAMLTFDGGEVIP